MKRSRALAGYNGEIPTQIRCVRFSRLFWVTLLFISCITAPIPGHAAPTNGWILRHPIAQEDFNRITVLDGCFYALGSGGTIARSCDGTSWATTTTGMDGPLLGLARGNGLFMAIGTNSLPSSGESATISWSTDAQTWAIRRYADISPFSSIAFGNGQFVTVVESGDAWVSNDGKTWQKRLFSGGLKSVSFGEGIFLAVGGEAPTTAQSGPHAGLAQAFVSTNGLDWVKVFERDGEPLRSAVSFPGGFLAQNAAHSYLLRKASDGSWSAAVGDPPPSRVAYGQGLFASPFGLRTSSDGLHWFIRPVPAALAMEEGQIPGNDLAFANGKWVCVGADGAIAVSEDLEHWSFPGWVSNAGFAAMAEGNGLLVAVGGTTITNVTGDIGQALMAISRDGGVTWEREPIGWAPPLMSITFAAGVFVAVGGNPIVDGSGVVLVSTNGTSWTSQPIEPTAALSKVIYSNNQFVAVGGFANFPIGSTYPSGSLYVLMTSTNGFDWATQRSASAGYYRDIVFAAGRYVLLLFSPYPTLYSSADLVNWSAPTSAGCCLPGLDAYASSALGLAFGSGRFRLSGTWISYDSMHWGHFYSTQEQPDAVIFTQGQFIGVRETRAFTSIDGVSWTVKETGSTYRLHGLGQFGSTVFALGEHGTILQVGSFGPTFQQPVVAFSGNGLPLLQLESTRGTVVSLQRSTDMRHWTSLGTVTNAQGLLQWADPNGRQEHDRAFYRALLGPP